MMRLSQLYQQPVFWVILSLALVISPHLSRFPGWATGLVLLLLGWRVLCIQRASWLAPKWLLFILIVISSIGIFIHFGTLFGKTAGSVLLAILLAIKTHESHSNRDYMLLIALSFFIIVTNFLFSQSIPTVIFMLLLVVVLVISMITIHQQDAPLSIQYKFRLASRLVLQALPLMLIMFVLFPRITGPLWKLPEEQQTAQTGLSDSMSPGNISSLIQSNALAFRVEFKDKIPPQHALYWRALVLWYFDGRSWEEGKTNITPWPSMQSSKKIYEYTMTIEPHQKNWLFGLDMPVRVPKGVEYTSNFLLRAKGQISSLFQYSLGSSLDYIIQPQISPWERSAGLKIPPNSNTRTVELGRQLAHKYQQPQQIIDHVLEMYNQQNFHYTLKPPLTPGFDPVDQFLFDTRRGFCEHYASSFTLLMRSAGIPARAVIGYQGGTMNPLNKVMTVRQKDAHAWSEVWIEDKGWVRIDPTAAIAPERVERNVDAALEPEERPFHMQINAGFARDLIFYLDAIDNQWKQWVIGYDDRLQQQLMQSIFNQRMSFQDMILMMVTGFALILGILMLVIIKPWKRKLTDPVSRIYAQFCHKLAKAGVTRQAHEGPVDFAERAIQQFPQQKDSISLITRLYTRLRYERHSLPKQLEQFRKHTREFRPARQQTQ